MFSVTFADILPNEASDYGSPFDEGLQPPSDLVDDFGKDFFDSLIDDAPLVFPDSRCQHEQPVLPALPDILDFSPEDSAITQQRKVPVKVSRNYLSSRVSRTSAARKQHKSFTEESSPFVDPVDDVLSEIAARVSPVDEHVLLKAHRSSPHTDTESPSPVHLSGKKRSRSNNTVTQAMSEEERLEMVRKRNREHARSTRKRKKQYVECLKKQVADLMERQKELESRGAEGQAIATEDESAVESLRKDLAQRFLKFTTSNVTDPVQWAELIEETFSLLQPRTPFRGASIGEYVGNNRRIQGIEEVIRDTTSVTAMLQMMNVRAHQQPNCPAGAGPVSLEYQVEPSDILVVGEKLMCHWKLTSKGLVSCGLASECCVDGMMKCVFNSNNKLVDMELTYDVMAFTRQLQQSSLVDWSVIQNGLSPKHSDSRRESDNKTLPSLKQAFGHLSLPPVPTPCFNEALNQPQSFTPPPMNLLTSFPVSFPSFMPFPVDQHHDMHKQTDQLPSWPMMNPALQVFAGQTCGFVPSVQKVN